MRITVELQDVMSYSLFVLLACVCWGFENNCTSSLSEKDTRQIRKFGKEK